jgi:hypothetical protein
MQDIISHAISHLPLLPIDSNTSFLNRNLETRGGMAATTDTPSLQNNQAQHTAHLLLSAFIY